MALYNRADYEGGLAEVEYALATSPNLAIAHGIIGAILTFSGCPKQGIAALERNIRLDPRDPQLAIRLNQMALAHYFSRETRKRSKWRNERSGHTPTIRIFTVGSRPRSASLAAPTKRQKHWRRQSRPDPARLRCSYATACPGCGPKTTPTCSKGCARPGGGRHNADPPSRRDPRRRCGGLFPAERGR